MRKIVYSLFLSYLMLFLCSCGSIPAKSHNSRTVTIAYNPNGYGSAISQIMVEDKILEKYLPQDTTVEWVQMSSASDIRDALASNAVNIAAPALSAFITAYENGMPLTLMSNYGNASVYLFSNKDVSSVEQFDPAADTIAIKGLNTNPHISFLAYIKERGLNVSEYNAMLTKIPEAETLALLEQDNSEISGAVLSYPVSNKAALIEDVQLVADFSSVIAEYNLGNCLCSNSKFYSENSDIISAFESARDEILQNWDANLEHNADVLTRVWDGNRGEIRDMMISIPPVKEVTGYNKLAALMYECGILDHEAALFEDLPNYDRIAK